MPFSSSSPANEQILSRAAFWLMLRRIAVLAACVDIVCLFGFLLFGLPAMAWPNLISIAMYVAAYVLLGRRRNLPAVLLMWTEVLVHATTSTILLGWSAGSHYFLLVFLPAVALSQSKKHAACALLFLLAVYLGLDAASQAIEPVYVLAPAAAMVLRWMAISVVFAMFGYTGRYYLEQVALAGCRLREMATTDPLSGLWNRRHFVHMATIELARSKRYGEPLALVIADIDFFKQVNDDHGHPVGDRVIQHVSGLLLSQLRRVDLAGRWGGEEFIVLLPSTTAEGAAQFCGRLREALEKTACEVDGTSIHVTLSFGIHQVDPEAGLEVSVKRADVALYEAKAGGRNRWVVGEAVAT